MAYFSRTHDGTPGTNVIDVFAADIDTFLLANGWTLVTDTTVSSALHRCYKWGAKNLYLYLVYPTGPGQVMYVHVAYGYDPATRTLSKAFRTPINMTYDANGYSTVTYVPANSATNSLTSLVPNAGSLLQLHSVDGEMVGIGIDDKFALIDTYSPMIELDAVEENLGAFHGGSQAFRVGQLPRVTGGGTTANTSISQGAEASAFVTFATTVSGTRFLFPVGRISGAVYGPVAVNTHLIGVQRNLRVMSTSSMTVGTGDYAAAGGKQFSLYSLSTTYALAVERA